MVKFTKNGSALVKGQKDGSGPGIPIAEHELADAGIEATPDEIQAVRSLKPSCFMGHLAGYCDIRSGVKDRVSIAKKLRRHAREIRALLRFMEESPLRGWIDLEKRGIRTTEKICGDINSLAELLLSPSAKLPGSGESWHGFRNPHRGNRMELFGPMKNWESWLQLPRESKTSVELNFHIAKWACFFQAKSGRPHYRFIAKIVYPDKPERRAVKAIKQAMSKNGSAFWWVPTIKRTLAKQKHPKEYFPGMYAINPTRGH